MEPIGGDRSSFAVYDETVMLKQIYETNLPDELPIDSDHSLLDVIDGVFNCPVSATGGSNLTDVQSHAQVLDDMTYHDSGDMFEAMAILINRISCEIECRCCSSGDAQSITPSLSGNYATGLSLSAYDGHHATTLSILAMVAKYSWQNKLVLVLSAFAVNYAVFLHVVQSHTSSKLAKSVAILRQLPQVLDEPSTLQSRFNQIRGLMKHTLDITKCIVKVYDDLSEEYISKAFTDQIAAAVYWTLRSVLVCASGIAGLNQLGIDQTVSMTENYELSRLSERLGKMHGQLLTELDASRKKKERDELIQSYQKLTSILNTVHIDNVKILEALINTDGYLEPLYNGATKRRVPIDVLRQKYVLLLISNVDILLEELALLDYLYNNSQQQSTSLATKYEVVWLPIADPDVRWTENEINEFEKLQADMTWYTLHSPLKDPAAVKFIKEKWQFRRKPIAVVLDPQGQVANENAIPMMWVWENAAYPFSTLKEGALWKEQTWNLNFLVDNVDQLILNWIYEGKFICLYGGEDIDWIRAFIITAREVARAAGISLEMVYVGKCYPKERVQKNIESIRAEKLSHCLEDLASIWFFWSRIDNMWQSRHQIAKAEPEKLSELLKKDYITREIRTMMNYGSSGEEWALISRGSAEMTRAKGAAFLTCLSQYNLWRNNVPHKGFLQALEDHLLQLHTPHHCNRLLLPATEELIPEQVLCSECDRAMEKFFMYQCCDE